MSQKKRHSSQNSRNNKKVRITEEEQHSDQSEEFTIEPAEQIEDIFISNELNEIQKSEKMSELFEQYKSEDGQKLIQRFNEQSLSIIRSRLNDCSTQSECELINIVELIVERASVVLNTNKTSNNSKSPLFDRFQKSKLLSSIQQILKKRIQYEQREYGFTFSILSEQLIRILFLIMYGQVVDKYWLNLSSRVTSTNNYKLIEMIRNNKNQGEGIQMTNNEQIINSLDSISKTLSALSLTAANEQNQRNLIQTNIYGSIQQLIHLFCPPEINCTHQLKLILQFFPSLEEFQINLFNALAHLYPKEDAQNQFSKQNSTVQHITPSIIKFADQISHHQQQQSEEYLPCASLDTITSPIYLLQRIMSDNYNNTSAAYTTPNFITSLIIIHDYNIRLFRNQEIEYQISSLIKNIQQCLLCIQHFGHESILQQLTNVGYAKSLIISIANGNDYIVLNDIETRAVQKQINVLFSLFRRGQHFPVYYPRQPAQIKTCEEQLEEEGGNEEIEAQLTNYELDKNEAQLTKKVLQNSFKINAKQQR